MKDVLSGSELLRELSPEHRQRILSIAERRELDAGEYLFRIGDEAAHAFVVVEGKLEACFPITFGATVRDVVVEERAPGDALGWSAFVSPHRFTLSARAAGPSAVAAFPRDALTQLIEGDSRLGVAFTRRIGEIVGTRLLKIQALWARELQRSVTGAAPGRGGSLAKVSDP